MPRAGASEPHSQPSCAGLALTSRTDTNVDVNDSCRHPIRPPPYLGNCIGRREGGRWHRGPWRVGTARVLVGNHARDAKSTYLWIRRKYLTFRRDTSPAHQTRTPSAGGEAVNPEQIQTQILHLSNWSKQANTACAPTNPLGRDGYRRPLPRRYCPEAVR